MIKYEDAIQGFTSVGRESILGQEKRNLVLYCSLRFISELLAIPYYLSYFLLAAQGWIHRLKI